MSVEFSALKEKPPTCIPKGYTSEASGPLLFLKERKRDSCLDVEIRGLYPIHAAKSICGGTNSINKYICLLRYKRSAPKQARYGGCQQLSLVRSRG